MHKVVVLKGRFRWDKHPGFGGRARLYGDRIVLRYWHRQGFCQHTIWLHQLVAIEYAATERINLTLIVDDGTTYRLWISGAHRWREYLEQWLTYDVLASAKILGSTTKAITMSG